MTTAARRSPRGVWQPAAGRRRGGGRLWSLGAVGMWSLHPEPVWRIAPSARWRVDPAGHRGPETPGRAAARAGAGRDRTVRDAFPPAGPMAGTAPTEELL